MATITLKTKSGEHSGSGQVVPLEQPGEDPVTGTPLWGRWSVASSDLPWGKLRQSRAVFELVVDGETLAEVCRVGGVKTDTATLKGEKP